MMRSVFAIFAISFLGACSFFGGGARNLDACNPPLPPQTFTKTGLPIPLDPIVVPDYCDDPGSSLFSPGGVSNETGTRRRLIPEDDFTQIDDSPRAQPLPPAVQPSTPETPTTPDEPATPVTLITPTTPVTPTTPETPVTPTTPDTPVTPTTPETPVTPTTPTLPEGCDDRECHEHPDHDPFQSDNLQERIEFHGLTS